MRLRNERLAWREIGGELVVLDLRSSTYFTANSTASVIIRVLVDGASRSELVEALLAEFDFGREALEADVDAFLAVLQRHDLLDNVESQ